MAADRRTSGATVRQLLALLPAAGRPIVAGLIAMAVAQVVVPLAIILATGALVERVTGAEGVEATAGPLLVLAALFGVQQVMGPVANVLWYRASSRIDGSLRVRAMRAVTRPTGIELLEDQAVQDLLPLAAGKPLPFRSAAPGAAAVGVIGLTARLVQGVGAAILVARYSPVLAVVLFVATVAFRCHHHRVNVAHARVFEDHVSPYRVAGYLSSLAMEPGPAKEMRVFGLTGWVRARHRTVWESVSSDMSAARHRACKRVVGGYLVVVPVYFAVFASVGLAAVDGRIGLGALAVVLQAARQLVDLGTLTGDDYQIAFGAASVPASFDLERRSAQAVAATPAGRDPGKAAMPAREIRFEGLTFAYPGSDRPVFDGLDLVVPAGTSMAIVGANGAGKTTLVKLLARLYEPTGGRILVDGVDLREVDPAAWRDRLAVIFQDFVRYELSAADNVGLGGRSKLGDRAALETAAARAGTRELIEALPRGWETVLARGYTDGCDLSGGEWQRIALARALLAVEAGATVLALDEPTANLDVRAELELFDRLLVLTGGPERRLTTLLVSHRFSTVRRSERICVLADGRVVELGSHEELVAADGGYARMFGLQAARFDG